MKWFIGFISLILSTGLVAQTTAISVIENPVISNLEEIQERMSTRQAVVEYQFVNIDLNSLQNETSIHIEFFDLNVIIFRDRLVRRSSESFSWFGFSENHEVSVTISINGSDVNGVISSSINEFRLETFGSTHTVQIINQSNYTENCNGILNDTKNGSLLASEANLENEKGVHECKIRVLVLYTPLAESRVNNIQNMIQLAEDEMNQSLLNSSIYREIDVVYVGMVEYSETYRIQDLKRFRNSNDGYMDNVHSLRNQYSADVCVLIYDDPQPGACGRAFNIRATESNAFCIVDWDCATGYYSFAHEIAHLIGSRHDIVADPDVVPYPYGHGYFDVGNTYRTIMGYGSSCGGCARKQYWSNPLVNDWNGDPMGDIVKSDNARVIYENYERVIFFRTTTQALSVFNQDVQDLTKEIFGGTISTSGSVVIQPGHSYIFRGETAVELLSGFETTSECEFQAIITPCGEKGVGDFNFKTASDVIENNGLDFSIKLFPNPVVDYFELKFLDQRNSKFDLTLYNSKGQIVREFIFKGEVSTRFNIQDIPKGVYLLEGRNEDGFFSLTVVKN